MMMVLTPQCHSEIVVKENLAEDDSLRDKRQPQMKVKKVR